MKKLLLTSMTAAALSANDSELQLLKSQLAHMEQMMKTMQEKITALESTKPSASVPVSKIATSISHPAHEEESHLTLSLIVDASYVNRSKKDEQLAHLELPGVAHGLFAPHNHNGSVHPTYNAQNGFNLNYAEMGVHSPITDYLEAEALLHFSETGVDIEEAYFTAHDLPYHFGLKGGKFLSDFGRLNNQHHHEWNFSDMPLVYEAFLGNHAIDEIGLQLQWTAPTDTYLMAGIEVLQGKNESMFGQAAISSPYDAEIILASSTEQPSLLIGYIKTSAEISDDTTIAAGVSWAHGQSRINHFSDEIPYAFSGTSDLFGTDLTLKHRFNHDASLLWQSELLYRDMEGINFSDPDKDLTTNDMISSSIRKKQSGYYTQFVYSPSETWSFGGRYDSIYQNRVIGIDQYTPENMDQYTAMLQYNAGENLRYRLQYTHSNAFFDEALIRQNINSLIFSINLMLGSHSEHSHD